MKPRASLLATIAAVTGALAVPSAALACGGGGGGGGGGLDFGSLAGAFGGNVLNAVGRVVESAATSHSNSGSRNYSSPPAAISRPHAAGSSVEPSPATTGFRPITSDFWTR